MHTFDGSEYSDVKKLLLFFYYSSLTTSSCAENRQGEGIRAPVSPGEKSLRLLHKARREWWHKRFQFKLCLCKELHYRRVRPVSRRRGQHLEGSQCYHRPVQPNRLTPGDGPPLQQISVQQLCRRSSGSIIS